MNKILIDQWTENEEKTVDADGLFDRRTSVTFSSYQVALQSCLELLGTRIAPIPVVLSVTSSPQTIAAVLRSGGHPVLLDIEATTLQIDPKQLQTVLESVDSAIVVLGKPQGIAIQQSLLDLTGKYSSPVIVDTKLPPASPKKLPMEGLFTVYDLELLCGGAVVACPFAQQVQELRIVRSGELGHDAALSKPQGERLQERLKKISSYLLDCELRSQAYIEKLQSVGKSGMIVFDKPTGCPHFLLKVPDAKKVIAHLHSYDIQAVLGVYPLCHLKELKERWKETPDYPVAMELEHHVVAIPCHPAVAGKESMIVDYILEVCE